jgi:Putative Actinobacterial Holin-X, holin superfamily III
VSDRRESGPLTSEDGVRSSAPPGAGRPLGAVIASAIGGARALVRGHVELARIEVGEAASVRAVGVGMMAAAAALCLLALGYIAASASAALDLVLPRWAAHLVLAAALVLVAGILVLVGRRTIRNAPAPGARTQEMLREDAQWVKRQIAR